MAPSSTPGAFHEEAAQVKHFVLAPSPITPARLPFALSRGLLVGRCRLGSVQNGHCNLHDGI